MNNTEIILEGNKLIAKFMKTKSAIIDDMYFGGDGLLYSKEDLRYHLLWDWLMPVIEKIEDTDDPDYKGFGHAFVMNNYEVNLTSLATGEIKVFVSNGSASSTIDIRSKIDASWFACVEFIKQYNKTVSLKNKENNGQ